MVKGKYKKAVRDRTRAEKNAAVLFWRNRDKLSILFHDKKRLVIQESNYVFERVQIDLVKMSDVEFENRRFRYNFTLSFVFEEYDNETGSHTDDEEEGTVTIEDMKRGSDRNMFYDEGGVLDTNKDYNKHCPYHESDEKTYDNGAGSDSNMDDEVHGSDANIYDDGNDSESNMGDEKYGSNRNME
ncbi:hypothetical protein DPMN_127392 [Dreissena polymorpha]|uniref:Uncharacterized protein n=1 Tax=Dreissena polymorpha TaxID=45954 RepID=A0A9D4JUT3_DREPO|nr:hypothetical protein DPMN_127392 [Dreissena polymorpha]